MRIPQSSPVSETQYEAGGYAKGVALATVTQNKDDQNLCRVKVRYSWSDTESYWARLAVPMAGKGRGWVTIPEVGDEVLVVFEREDIRYPYIVGSLWNGKQTPPVNNSNGKNDVRILKSRKQHHLMFDDGSKGVVELKHEKGRKIRFDDDGFIVEDEKGNVVQVDSTSGNMSIKAKGHLQIKAKTISIEADATMEIKAGATLNIKGQLININ
ncbi:phage baseplate assembly protein V [Gimesia fumaroli]|uniref:Phage-related baseplate assembly protein n=1 Tax=Gimesia fumaroli TaxID=2527976 RepID=A0A518I9V7_9PLAN|nr:phage baseplate assembly protein V [Gimesia fumaroli]QDV49897.1 Phage-related baseplate assembly protein [Gimesia fumaroli]